MLTVDDLGLPAGPEKFPLLKKGLILVTGPTGLGKSTTLAAMMDYANLSAPRSYHHGGRSDPNLCIAARICLAGNIARLAFILVPLPTPSARGLREDPDILLVGEMRDLETIELALTAAATGHSRFRNASHLQCFQSRRSCHRRFPRQISRNPNSRYAGGIAQGRHRTKSFSSESTNQDALPPWKFWWSTWRSQTSCAKRKRTKSPA